MVYQPGAHLDPAEAENIAIWALAYLATDPERLGRFLSATGIGPADLRQAASEATFQAGLLNYIMSDESLLLGFASSRQLAPSDVAAAQRTLSGGQGGTDGERST